MLVVLNAAEGQLDVIVGQGAGLGAEQDAGQSAAAEVLCAQHWAAPSRGTEILAPALAALLPALGKRPADVRRWASVCGPGSFTGLRLTLTTLAAIRRVTGAQLAGLDFMQALACTAQRLTAHSHDVQSTGHIWVLTHARRDLVHAEAFTRHDSGIPQPVAAVELVSPAEAAAHMLQSPVDSVVLGSGLGRNAAVLAPALASVTPLAETRPSGDDLWLLAQHAVYSDHDLDPLYIRPCDAVDNLSHIATKQGMEPEVAHARLAELLSAPPVVE